MLSQTQKNKNGYCFLNIIIFIQKLFVYPSKNFAYHLLDCESVHAIKSAEYMVKSKTKSISNLGTFSNFLKLNVQSIIFSKFPHVIEAAAICFFMERGRRKSQQSSRICVRAQIKLVIQYKTCLTHPKSWMIGRSKELEDVGRVSSSFPTYLGKIEATLLAGYGTSG